MEKGRQLPVAALCLILIILGGCAPAPEPGSQPAAPAADPAPFAEAQDPAGITLGEALQILPLSPGEVRVQSSEEQIVIEWSGTGEGLSHYEVYGRSSGGEDWRVIGRVTATAENTGAYQWTGASPAPGSTFGIAAVDTRGIRSAVATP